MLAPQLGDTISAGQLQGQTVLVVWLGNRWQAFNPDTCEDPEILEAMDAAIDRKHGPGAAKAIAEAFG